MATKSMSNLLLSLAKQLEMVSVIMAALLLVLLLELREALKLELMVFMVAQFAQNFNAVTFIDSVQLA
jgi:hypothetical protein